MSSLSEIMDTVRSQTRLNDFQTGLTIHLQCFIGQALLEQNLPAEVCSELLGHGYIVPVAATSELKFDRKGLYRFQGAEESGVWMEPVMLGESQSGWSLPRRGDTGRELYRSSIEDSSSYDAPTETGSSGIRFPWTDAEDEKLVTAVSRYGEDWIFVAHGVGTRSEEECEARWIEKLLDAKTPKSHHRKRSLGLKIPRKKRQSEAEKAQEEARREYLQSQYLKRKDEYQTERTKAISNVGGGERRARNRTGSGDLERFIGEDRASSWAEAQKQELEEASTGEIVNVAGGRVSLPAWRGERMSTLTDYGAVLKQKRLIGHSSSSEKELTSKIEKVKKEVVKPETCETLVLIVMGLSNPPETSKGIRESHYLVRIEYDDGKYVETRSVVRRPKMGITWGELVTLDCVNHDTMLDISLRVKHRVIADEEIGRTQMSVGDLVKRPYRNLVLSNSSSAVVMDSDEVDVTLLKIGVDKSTIPPSWPLPVRNLLSAKNFDKHLMIITRGTRGDVQPFLALARGLAEKYDWMITICTELRYLNYVKQNAQGLSRGCIRFRISGGDTQKRVDSRLSKWAMNTRSETMQSVMLAFSEAEFFDSEPALFYWAKTMEPDYLMFGFTLAGIAMIISEALNIPLIGFLLQPTCIPSSQYPPVIPLDEDSYKKLCSIDRKKEKKHTEFSALKVLMENNPMYGNLNHMRQKRGLAPMKRYVGGAKLTQAFRSNTWTDLQAQGVPLIAPINEFAFGGKPNDWGQNSVLTNYIFLRGDTVPPLNDDIATFISTAKSKGQKLIALAFSSMPVSRLDILRLAIKIITKCKEQVSVIALIGNHTDDPEHDAKVENEANRLTNDGRLFVVNGAPFGRLFPLLDIIVAHGGLGTTGEAIMSKVPVIITGVLLFDQRFWGSRCHDMDIGPFPVHVSKFHKVCVELIDQCFEPGNKWAENAKKIGEKISDSMKDDPSGVDINATVVHDMAEIAPVYRYQRPVAPSSTILNIVRRSSSSGQASN